MPKPAKTKSKQRQHRLETLFLRIGEVTVVWAYLEMALDLCAVAIHNKWDGSKVVNNPPKNSFARRLEYFRKCSDGIPHFKVIFPEFDALVDELEELSVHRHRLVHGMACGIESYHLTGTATMRRILERTSEGDRSEAATYDIGIIKSFRNQVLRTAVLWGALAEILQLDPAREDNANYPLGELLMKLT